MDDRSEEVLTAIKSRKKVTPSGEGLQFYLISYSTFNDFDITRLRSFQDWVKEKYNIEIPIIGGGYGCTIIDFEVVAEDSYEAANFVKNLICNQDIHEKIKEFKFKILITRKPYTRIDLSRGTMEGGVGLEKILDNGINMNIDKSTTINGPVTDSNVNANSIGSTQSIVINDKLEKIFSDIADKAELDDSISKQKRT